MFPSFEYVLSAHRFSEIDYVSILPIKHILKILSTEDQEIPASVRAKRALEEIYNPLTNPGGNICKLWLKRLIVVVDANLSFEVSQSSTNVSQAGELGHLRIPMDSKLIVVDGMQTLSALRLMVPLQPALKEECMTVVFIQDSGLTPLPEASTTVNTSNLQDFIPESRNPLAKRKRILAEAAISAVEVFKQLTDTEHSTLPTRSKKLFTLSSIQNATLALLIQRQNSSLLEQTEIAICFWNKVSDCIPDWKAVLRKEKSAGELRKNYVHCHAVMLTVLGHLGASLLSTFPEDWEAKMEGLGQVDWSRSNPEWQGKIIIEKRIFRSLESITLTTIYLKKQLQIPLTSKEQALG